MVRTRTISDAVTFILDWWKHSWQVLLQVFTLCKSKNLTFDNKIQMPPIVPINHYFGLRNQQIRANSYSIIPCSCIQTIAWFEYSNFFKVDVVNPIHTQQRAHGDLAKNRSVINSPSSGPIGQFQNSATRFLTAATLLYAIGAGITAAAGTKLALQLILVKGFKLYSFKLRELLRPHTIISCYYLHVLGLGNFCACCLT